MAEEEPIDPSIVKKKENDARFKKYQETIGVEDNKNYHKFKDKERLLINIANCKYPLIKFVSKQLFNFRVTTKKPDEQPAVPNRN